MSELNFTHSNGNKVKLTTPDTLTANKTFKLPGADGTANQTLITDGNGALSFATPSASMVDSWRLTTNFNINSVSGDHLTLASNWERSDNTGETTVNGAMTVDSSTGYWTFPSTGKYKVEFNLMAYSTVASRYIDCQMMYSINGGGSFQQSSRILQCIGIANGYCSGHMYNIFYVDNLSNNKVLFRARSYSTGSLINGNTNTNQTHVLFTKLGDL